MRSAYPWLIVVLAAGAMVATLPGRTHGLGMITERLLQDARFAMDRVRFSEINLWATLLGAAFCLPCGALMDRFGLRDVLCGVVLALAGVVFGMTVLSGTAPLFGAILLTRGLGQSALSVVSLTMVGKWFPKRLSLAMGVYSVLVAVGFSGAFRWGKDFSDSDWRLIWSGLAGALVLFAVIAAVLVHEPGSGRLNSSAAECCRDAAAPPSGPAADWTLTDTLRSPAFWVFGLASSTYGLVSSGISLFNESILAERGFDKTVFYEIGSLTPLIAMGANFAGGWLGLHCSLHRLLAAAMTILSVALFWLPHMTTRAGVLGYAVAMGIAGGLVTVVFFSVWGQAFGRKRLGAIQGAAQMLTVVASALGPRLLAESQARTGSYSFALYALACASLLQAALAWAVREPRAAPIADPRPQSAAPAASVIRSSTPFEESTA